MGGDDLGVLEELRDECGVLVMGERGGVVCDQSRDLVWGPE